MLTMLVYVVNVPVLFSQLWREFGLMHMPCLCLLLFKKDRRSSGHIIEDYINPSVGEFLICQSG